jgi:hypothetical protein
MATDKEWRMRNPEKVAAIRARNLEQRKASGWVKHKEWTAKKRASDVQYRLANNLRSRLYKALTRESAIKSASTGSLIGCSGVELMAHLEAQFLPGMSWENHGEWEIDHIKPCASFDLTDPAQQRECFNYTNLQPLWRRENRQKKDRLDWEPAAA